jgi:predicted amidohydrolase YtcJ
MRKSWQFNGCIILLLLSASCSREVSQSPQQTGTTADLILTNGRILTVDADFTIAEALAISGDRIFAVGTSAEINTLSDADTVITDLQGRTVVPGLIDNHNHFVRATEQWYRQVRWDEVTTRAHALQLLQERAAALPEGEWVVVLGGWIFEQFTDNQQDFTRAELDALLPNTPVYIQQGYGRGFANSPALTQAGLTPTAALPPGVEVIDGALTGVLNGSPAFLSVADNIPPTPDATWDNSVQLTMQDYLAQGMTTLLDIGGNTVTPRHYEVLKRAASNNVLRMRVFYTLNATNGVGASADAIIEALNSNPSMSGNDQFGQFTYGEMTFEGIRDPAGGAWNPAPEALADYGRILRTAADKGWQIHEHSTRDDKMQAALDLMATVNATTPIAPLRWTIAHAEQASDATIAKAKELGVVFALHSSGGLGAVASARGGADVSRVPPIRQINDADILWGLGSDGTVVSGFHPFQNIGWAVTGIAKNGEKLLQATVSREDALRAHTISNATLLFKEEVIGSLEPGKYADLVVLDRDYMDIPETEIKDIKPILTMVNGEVVYTAPRNE